MDRQQEPIAELDHEFDLDMTVEDLELFAEELPGQHQRYGLAGKTLSTLACDCTLSTFGCLSGTFAA
jgi:hypothetical protein